MVNSKNKGNTFERKIANILSKRFETVTGIPRAFRKSVDSGSFFGGRNVARISTHDLDKATFGDIIAPSNFRYHLECKHYKEPPSFSSLMAGDIKDWDGWIAQATQDCAQSGGKLAIIIKYNNCKEVVILAELPPDLSCSVTYKNHYVILFDAFLSIPDGNFFKPNN